MRGRIHGNRSSSSGSGILVLADNHINHFRISFCHSVFVVDLCLCVCLCLSDCETISVLVGSYYRFSCIEPVLVREFQVACLEEKQQQQRRKKSYKSLT